MNLRVLHKDLAATLVLVISILSYAQALVAEAQSNNSKVAPKLTEREKDIAKRVAAKEPLRSIIDSYAKKGVAITEVVYSAIKAGVDPGLVVYTAIVEGYSARPVVSFALRAGAPIDKVVEAALGAGADKRFIYLGATDAGVSVGAIAKAVTSNASPTANNTATDKIVSDVGSVYIPVDPVVLSGGAGGTPSTQIASPYKP